MIGPASSRFQGIQPLAAWFLLSITGGLMAYGVYVHGRTQTLIVQNVAGDRGDYSLYHRIVERVHGGEGYYDAAASELRAGGYPLRPFLTWRTPTLAWILGVLPSMDGIWGLLYVLGMTGLSVIALFLWSGVMEGQVAPWLRWICAILLAAQLWITTVLAPFQHEVWAGLGVALALALHGRGFWRTSVAAGVLAVFIRELALPLLVIMLALAWWRRQRGEAIAWLLGLVAFGAFLGFHAWMVTSHVTQADRLGPGWLQTGGWPFVLMTARANVFLLWPPSWVAGLVLPLVLLGLAGWPGSTGARVFLLVMAYVISFLFVGRPIHAYWGLLYAPLLPPGLILAPRVLGDLVRAAVRSPVPDDTRQASSGG